MAKEAIEEIKKVEAKAKKIVEDAKANSLDLILKAKEDNKRAYELLSQELENKQNNEIKSVNEQLQKVSEQSIKEAYDEIKKLEKKIYDKSDYVIEKIINKVIS